MRKCPDRKHPVPQPLIDHRFEDMPRASTARRRQVIVLVTLAGFLALLFFLAFSDYGASPTALLIVLCGFAALGIAALLALSRPLRSVASASMVDLLNSVISGSSYPISLRMREISRVASSE